MEERSTGRTTRLVDYYIQQLFDKKLIFPKDHYNTWSENQNLMNKIICRLHNEHHGLKFYTNYSEMSISLEK